MSPLSLVSVPSISSLPSSNASFSPGSVISFCQPSISFFISVSASLLFLISSETPSARCTTRKPKLSFRTSEICLPSTLALNAEWTAPTLFQGSSSLSFSPCGFKNPPADAPVLFSLSARSYSSLKRSHSAKSFSNSFSTPNSLDSISALIPIAADIPNPAFRFNTLSPNFGFPFSKLIPCDTPIDATELFSPAPARPSFAINPPFTLNR